MSTTDWLFTQQSYLSDIVTPISYLHLISFLKTNKKRFSIAGKQFSSGGQTLVDNGVIISLSNLNSISEIDTLRKEYTVESGASWSDVLNILTTYNLVPFEMQSYNSFSIGGSISVNAHGRMSGRVSDSIVWIDTITSSGEIIRCSPITNSDLFYSVIGGYGLVAIIWRVRLRAKLNKMLICKVYPHDENRQLSDEIKYFDSTNFILYNCTISNIQQIYHIVWESTDDNVNENSVAIQQGNLLTKLFTRLGENVVAFVSPLHDWFQAYRPYQINGTKRLLSYEMGYNASDLIPLTPFRLLQSLLQEYFLPLESLDRFRTSLFELIDAYQINVLNLSVRIINFTGPSSYLDWANFPGNFKIAVVLYINIFNFIEVEPHYKNFTHKLIQIALDLGGTWYLPYYPAFTKKQLLQAYPNFFRFVEIKKQYDPENKLSSKFWQYCLEC